MSVADASSFMVPSTPASSSMASSEVSTTHSPVQMNIWTLFRLPVGSEQTHIVQKVGTKRHKKVLHYCLSCEKQKAKPIWSSAYTGNAKEHVQKMHRAEWKEWSRNRGDSLRTDGPNQASIDRYMQPVGVHSSRHLTLRQAFDKPRFIRAFIALCARRRVSLSATDWPELQELMLAGNPTIQDLLKLSRRTLVRLLERNHVEYRKRLQTAIQDAVGQIHFSTDMWTSPARRGHLAICAQWVDCEYRLRKALLGLPQVLYSHGGECQALHIVRVLRSYGITTRIGYHTGDNATSNDTMLRVLSDHLMAEYNFNFDPVACRIRCLDHILNLALQAFLLAKSKEALKAALDAIDVAEDADPYEVFSAAMGVPMVQNSGDGARAREIAERARDKRKQKGFEGWGSTPALEKLHNLAVWLRNSPIHHDLWERDIGISLGIDNDTRWSSWYFMIDRAIRKKNEIIKFLHEHDEACGPNTLTHGDWEILICTHQFLQVFNSGTLWVEGDRAGLSQSLEMMDVILAFFEEQKNLYSSGERKDLRMVHSIEMGWFILNKYYELTDTVPVYAAAMLLDPSKRRRYLTQNWPEKWHQKALDATQRIWEDKYMNMPLTQPERDAMQVDGSPPSPDKPRNELDRLKRSLQVEMADIADEDDVQLFLNARPISIKPLTPLEWWCLPEQRQRYPRLHRMAIDILSIPPSSAEPERTFSGARRTQSWDRLRMTANNLERLECIGNWLRNGHIDLVHIITAIEDMSEMEVELDFDSDEMG